MIKRNLIAAVLVAASLSSLVEAGVTGVTGNDLKKHCHGQNDADVNFCMGYLFGIFDSESYTGGGVFNVVFDVQDAADYVIGMDTLMICMPAGDYSFKMFDIIIKYLDENPAKLHKPAIFLVHIALNEAFPCKEGE